MSFIRLCVVGLVVSTLAACGGDGGPDASTGGGTATGGGSATGGGKATGGGSATGGGGSATGGGTADDAGIDAGTDAGMDAGTDAGVDAGMDAGADAGVDAGSGCAQPSECPGTDTDCQARTCTSGVCGFSFTASGTAVATQTAGDCQQRQCDGQGSIVSVALNSDLPVDGNQCTDDVCTTGVPSNPPKAANATCTSNGGAFCDGAGACVACTVASQCTGMDTECQTRTCNAGVCGFQFVMAMTPTATQTAGDCSTSECNGFGATVSVANDADVPVDNNVCTSDVCTAGVPSNPPTPVDTACNAGGTVCDGAGTCVACNIASQCTGSDTECQVRTCSMHACGLNFTPGGTATSMQTAGDCQQRQCDGAGAIVSVALDSDVPNDSNTCTGDVCTSGAPSNPPLPAGSSCMQNGGTACDGAGQCVSPPVVLGVTPADGATTSADGSIGIVFSTSMNPATLSEQTAAGACTGSIQVSLDAFASCIAFSSATPVLAAGNTVASLTPAPGLLVNRVYQVRVTTDAQGSSGLALAMPFSQPTGFTTTSPNLCDNSVVISQVYGGGGSGTSAVRNDFVELHNRSSADISLVGWSIQYGSATGTTWAATTLVGSIPANGYYLVQLAAGSVGTPLPTPDATGTTAMSGTNGKVALVRSTTQLPGGACPGGANVIDFASYGVTNCAEGTSTAVTSATTSITRVAAGCADVNDNSLDFTVGVPNPRNSASTVQACACLVQNESDVALEADYCTVQFPLSLSGQTGTASAEVFGQLFEVGVTEAAGANSTVRAQFGYGPLSANPQYQPWTWSTAPYNVQSGNNDEYKATITLPAVGVYGYAYRFSLDQGVSWTVCDQNAGDSGSGSNAALSFSLGDIPVLTVTP